MLTILFDRYTAKELSCLRPVLPGGDVDVYALPSQY
jgi:hypothetical protein